MEDFKKIRKAIAWEKYYNTPKKDWNSWYDYAEYDSLSEECMAEFADKFNWHKLCQYQKMSEEFIIRFQDKVDWYNISWYQELTPGFISVYREKVNWVAIWEKKKIDIDTIKEWYKQEREINFPNKSIHWLWSQIFECQKVDEEFIAMVFEDCPGLKHLYLSFIQKFQKHISKDFLKKYAC